VKASCYALLPKIVIFTRASRGELVVGGFTRAANHRRIVDYLGSACFSFFIVLYLFLYDVFQLEFKTFASSEWGDIG
jgi:hypothetical protein